LPRGRGGQRKIVEGGNASLGVAEVLGECERSLEVTPRELVIAAIGGEDAEDVAGLRERAVIAGPLRQPERLGREGRRPSDVATSVCGKTAVRVHAGDEARIGAAGLDGPAVVLLRVGPVAAAVVHARELVLDAGLLFRGGTLR